MSSVIDGAGQPADTHVDSPGATPGVHHTGELTR
jgi:hypothetical protein